MWYKKFNISLILKCFPHFWIEDIFLQQGNTLIPLLFLNKRLIIMNELQELKQRVNELELICKELLKERKSYIVQNASNFNLFKNLYSEGVYTQREIAETIGVSTRTIRRYIKKLN